KRLSIRPPLEGGRLPVTREVLDCAGKSDATALSDAQSRSSTNCRLHEKRRRVGLAAAVQNAKRGAERRLQSRAHCGLLLRIAFSMKAAGSFLDRLLAPALA